MSASGFIYLAACRTSAMVKIGFSKAPAKRVKQLRYTLGQKFDLVTKIRGTLSREQRIHRLLVMNSSCCLGRECYTPDVLSSSILPIAFQRAQSIHARCVAELAA